MCESLLLGSWKEQAVQVNQCSKLQLRNTLQKQVQGFMLVAAAQWYKGAARQN